MDHLGPLLLQVFIRWLATESKRTLKKGDEVVVDDHMIGDASYAPILLWKRLLNRFCKHIAC